MIAKKERVNLFSAYDLSVRCGLKVTTIQKWEMGESRPNVELLPGLLKGCGEFAYIIFLALGFSEDEMEEMAKGILARRPKDREVAKNRRKGLQEWFMTTLYENLEMDDNSEIASKQRSMADKRSHAH